MSNLSTKAMLVRFSVSHWNAEKKDKRIEKEIAHNHGIVEDAISAKKQLLAKEVLAKRLAHVQKVRLWHYAHTLPWGDEGYRILPTKMYWEYTQKMADFRELDKRLIEELAATFLEAKENSKIRLNDLYNEGDFPTLEKFQTKYGITVNAIPLPESDDFRCNLQQEEVERLRKDYEDYYKKAIDGASKNLWQRLYDVVKHFADRVKAKEEDDKVNFHKSSISNIKELIDLLDSLNVGEDVDLANMAKQVEKELCGRSAEEIKENKVERQDILAKTEKILQDMKDYF